MALRRCYLRTVEVISKLDTADVPHLVATCRTGADEVRVRQVHGPYPVGSLGAVTPKVLVASHEPLHDDLAHDYDVATLVLECCEWTVMHPGVPPEKEGAPGCIHVRCGAWASSGLYTRRYRGWPEFGHASLRVCRVSDRGARLRMLLRWRFICL